MAKTNSIDIHVGERLRRVRLQRNMSQQALGEAIGVSLQQIEKYEKGVNRIGVSTLWEIAKTLGAPVSVFYEGLVDRAPPERALIDDKAAVEADVKFIRDYLALPPAVKARAQAFVFALCGVYRD